ncbi:carboxypeptidase M32 [Paenibacillus yanchengensis]|uniref:Metal-dependent carboxypeptidase n=1 Tax=Paenibacillus yanchengensis TaxID=2035833 RepID=A0ABW4YK42_9BACL
MKQITETLDSFLQLDRKLKYYEEAIGLMYWDLRTGAPKQGVDIRSEVIGELSAEQFKLATSAQLGEWLTTLEEQQIFAQLDEVSQTLVTETRKAYDRNILIPAPLYKEYVVLASQSEAKWEEAKENNDFASFEPYLQKIIDYKNQFIDIWGVTTSRYDTLLDEYEPGMTVTELDRIFGQLRGQLVDLLARIQASPHQPDRTFLQQSFPIAAQKQLSLQILEQMGFNFQAGRLDESVHPFAIGLNPGDVRITTRYLEDDVTSALFGTIHEGGHALYEQNIAQRLAHTTLCTGTSMGIHESQSRFWENVIGRSRPFWNKNYSKLQSYFPNLQSISVDQFYRANNIVEPSLIRIEADELTYNLHIIIRYELEKMIFNEGLQAKDLPAAWNEKYEQYLGIKPQTDSDGVLQDVHWSGGDFGYFPSYSLGNMYAAQFAHTMEQHIPAFWSLVADGNLLPMKDWLTERIYQYGKLKTPEQLIVDVTGKSLDPTHLVTYLTNKYSDIYQL